MKNFGLWMITLFVLFAVVSIATKYAIVPFVNSLLNQF